MVAHTGFILSNCLQIHTTRTLFKLHVLPSKCPDQDYIVVTTVKNSTALCVCHFLCKMIPSPYFAGDQEIECIINMESIEIWKGGG